MGKKSSFPNKQLGHARINPSETKANADTWRRLRESHHTPEPVDDFRTKLAPWAAVRPRAPEKRVADTVTLPPVPVAAPTTASPPPITSNAGNGARPALNAVIAEGAAHGGLDDHLRHSLGATPLPRALTKHKNPEPRPISSIIAPQYSRGYVPNIDYKDGTIIDLKVIQAEGAAMKSQRRRLEQERLRQQQGSER